MYYIHQTLPSVCLYHVEGLGMRLGQEMRLARSCVIHHYCFSSSAVMFSFAQPTYTVSEIDGSVILRVIKVGRAMTPVTIAFRTTNGSAQGNYYIS